MEGGLGSNDYTGMVGPVYATSTLALRHNNQGHLAMTDLHIEGMKTNDFAGVMKTKKFWFPHGRSDGGERNDVAAEFAMTAGVVKKLNRELLNGGKGARRSGVYFAVVGLLAALPIAGCASKPGATGTSGLLNFTNDAVTGSSTEAPIECLGAGLEIGAAADSWPALVEKTKPTFAWNGCDLMWIETGEGGCPYFIMDEAYTYQPTNRQAQKVLLIEDPNLRESYSDPTDGRNLRRIAELWKVVPDTLIEAGRGELCRGDFDASQIWHRIRNRMGARNIVGDRVFPVWPAFICMEGQYETVAFFGRRSRRRNVAPWLFADKNDRGVGTNPDEQSPVAN